MQRHFSIVIEHDQRPKRDTMATSPLKINRRSANITEGKSGAP